MAAAEPTRTDGGVLLSFAVRLHLWRFALVGVDGRTRKTPQTPKSIGWSDGSVLRGNRGAHRILHAALYSEQFST